MIILDGSVPSYRIAAVCDLHTGNKDGLNPMDAPYMPGPGSVCGERNRALNEFYFYYVKKYNKPDMVLVNGDAIDGPGVKTHGIEQFTTDLSLQTEMATQLLLPWEPTDGYRLTCGTGYHTEMYGQPEYTIAKNLKAAFNNEDWFRIENKTFNVKHYIPVGGNEATQAGILTNEVLRLALAKESRSYPDADVIIRSHAHVYIGVSTSEYTALLLPALQLPGGLYGTKIPVRPYNVGIVIIDILKDGSIHWDAKLLDLKISAPKVDEYQVLRAHETAKGESVGTKAKMPGFSIRK